PADVRAAGYIIEPYNEQWRWRRELLAGGIEYGAPYRTRDAAIADARRMVQARGPAAPAEPAPATLDDLDVLDRELAPWPLDSEAAVGEELDDPIVAAGGWPPAASSRSGAESSEVAGSASGSAASSQQLAAGSQQPDEDPRIAELRATIAIYQAALGAGSAYVRLTGFHTHRVQADRILRAMIEQLERNLTALEGDHD
ncbi:MAG TPA: hypothetical protein VNK95_15185, partial [Caldilineaceae bacterium]|nr:hypothetical protein [Caldilineaceae bacterium]